MAPAQRELLGFADPYVADPRSEIWPTFFGGSAGPVPHCAAFETVVIAVVLTKRQPRAWHPDLPSLASRANEVGIRHGRNHNVGFHGRKSDVTGLQLEASVVQGKADPQLCFGRIDLSFGRKPYWLRNRFVSRPKFRDRLADVHAVIVAQSPP